MEESIQLMTPSPVFKIKNNQLIHRLKFIGLKTKLQTSILGMNSDIRHLGDDVASETSHETQLSVSFTKQLFPLLYVSPKLLIHDTFNCLLSIVYVYVFLLIAFFSTQPPTHNCGTTYMAGGTVSHVSYLNRA